MNTVLTIAGSDTSGGAGIQADIKTITAHNVYAMSCITALTAQNTLGISEVMEVPAPFFEKQMESVFSDIIPDSVKTGMFPSAALVQITAAYLKKYQVKNVVIDPVMISSSGTRLLGTKTMEKLEQELFPLAKLLTPNLPEAEVLSGIKIHDREEQKRAAQMIGEKWGCAVLCKGGHASGKGQQNSVDILYDHGTWELFSEKRVSNPNTHGTGCTLSSAIAANLSKGESLSESVKKAKAYITGAIAAMLDLGKGNGPLNHMWNLETKI